MLEPNDGEIAMKPIDWIFLIGTVTAGLIGLTVIAGAVFGTTPSEVLQWGGTIIGFFFGTFFTLMKDYLRMTQEAQTTVAAQNPSTTPVQPQPTPPAGTG